MIIDDNDEIVEAIKLTLIVRWPVTKILTANNGVDALALAEQEKPELILLDLGLPGINGFEVLKRLRLFSRCPVIVVTARSDEADIVKALEIGANDYIVKPFRQMELLSRVNNQIRKNNEVSESSPLFNGQLSLHPSTHDVCYASKHINLTPIESSLLAVLMRNAGQTVTHNTLAVEIWGECYPEASNILKVHVCRLRQKLEDTPSIPKMILTRAGVGYCLAKLDYEVVPKIQTGS